MLRTISPNISVITNWGCRANCWYCIWKGHKLENIRLSTDWQKLEDFLTKYREKGKVSVSGGGDCLYKYDQYVGWWIRFFELTEKLENAEKVCAYLKSELAKNHNWKEFQK